MQIVNVGKEPYYFMFDSREYGPLMPGEVVDLPPDLANHAIHKSAIWDGHGGVSGYTVQGVADVDPRIIRYVCPLAKMGSCDAKSFGSLAELADHIAEHDKQEPPSRSAPKARDLKL